MTYSTTSPSDSGIQASATLDTSGLLCPLPVYKASVALQKLAPGEVLELVCTDPGSLADIPALAHRVGHRLLRTVASGGKQTFWLEKRASRSESVR